MRFVIIALMTCSLITSCGQDVFEYQTLTLPDVVEYSAEVQTRAANELVTYSVPTLSEFMKDYNVMRNQVRVARGAVICPQPDGVNLCE